MLYVSFFINLLSGSSPSLSAASNSSGIVSNPFPVSDPRNRHEYKDLDYQYIIRLSYHVDAIILKYVVFSSLDENK